MTPLPAALAKLAREFRWPEADKKGDPNSTFTLTAPVAAAFSALLFGLISHLVAEYARCAETKAPPRP